jgi:hypothetical protein
MCSASAGISARASFRVGGLKVQPVLRRGAERLAEPNCHLSTDRAIAIHDPRNRVVRHMDVFSELAGAQTKSLKFIAKEAARMDRGKVVNWVCHHGYSLYGGYPLPD